MDKLNLKDIGPLQILAVAFHKPDFKGRIREELQKLRDQKFIRIVDGIAVQKNDKGEIAAIEESDISQDESKTFGAVIGGWIGLGSGNQMTAMKASEEMAEKFNERYQFGLDKDDLMEMAADIPNGDAAIVLLVEHRWLIPFRNEMRNAGGTLLAQDFLSPELLMTIGQQSAAAA
jgi:uncharacterized membrane protein